MASFAPMPLRRRPANLPPIGEKAPPGPSQPACGDPWPDRPVPAASAQELPRVALVLPRRKRPLDSAASREVAVPTPFSARQRFEVGLAHGLHLQPPAGRPAWEKAVTELALDAELGLTEQSLALLAEVCAQPLPLQARLARWALALVGPRGPLAARQAVLQTLTAAHAKHGRADLEALLAALKEVDDLAVQRQLLPPLVQQVPAGQLALFLRAAECLLAQAAHEPMAVAALLEAVRQSQAPATPRGRTGQEREEADARMGQRRRRGPTPAMTAADEALISRLQNEALDEAEDFGDLEALLDGELDAELFSADETEDDETSFMAAMEEGLAGLPPRPDWQAEEENVQNAPQIRAVKLAWQRLNQAYPRTLSHRALFALVDGAYQLLQKEAEGGCGPFAGCVLANMEKQFPLSLQHPQEQQILLKMSRLRKLAGREVLAHVYAGKAGDGGRMAPLRSGADMAHNLDEEGLDSRRFLAQLWRVIHRDRTCATTDAAAAKQDRANLRHSFWAAIMDNAVVHVAYGGGLTLERLCSTGLANRLLLKLTHYEAIDVAPLTPQQLLAARASEFCGTLEDGDAPSVAELAQFCRAALEDAATTFNVAERATFAEHLRDYVNLSFEEQAGRALVQAGLEGPVQTPAPTF